MSALFQARDQSDRITKWILLHSKQTKVDMELRVWGDLHQKSGSHCLQASNLLKIWDLLKGWFRFGMALRVSATSVQNDFRFYLYVCLISFYRCGKSNWKLLISDSLLVWRGWDYPNSSSSWLLINFRCPIEGLSVSLTWPTLNYFHT